METLLVIASFLYKIANCTCIDASDIKYRGANLFLRIFAIDHTATKKVNFNLTKIKTVPRDCGKRDNLNYSYQDRIKTFKKVKKLKQLRPNVQV